MTGSKPDAGQSAFTLLEVLVMLGLLGLGLAFAISKPKESFFEFEKSVSAIRNGLLATRAQAVKTNEAALFTLDLERRSFSSPAIQTTELPGTVAIAAETADAERLDDRKAGIRFFPNGRSTGGAIALEYAGQRARVEVNWLTGHASIRR